MTKKEILERISQINKLIDEIKKESMNCEDFWTWENEYIHPDNWEKEECYGTQGIDVTFLPDGRYFVEAE